LPKEESELARKIRKKMSLAIKDTMQSKLTKRLSSKISDNEVNLQDAIDEAYQEHDQGEYERQSVSVDRPG